MNELNQLPTDYQTIIHKLHYARWLEEEQRREDWGETVNRYVNFMEKHIRENYTIDFTGEFWNQLVKSIYTLDVMPSMRGLWVAGKALERDHASLYNCSFIAIDSPHAWSEACYLSMCLHPDTVIMVRGGPKKISEITVDDEVATLDEASGEISWIKPEKVWANSTEEKEKIKLYLEDGSEVTCTSDHLFLTKNRGWVQAKDITEVDEI